MNTIKRKFWESKLGQLIHFTMHESNNAVAVIKMSTQLLEDYHKKNALTKEIIEKHINDVLSTTGRIIGSLDYLYNKSKDKWESKVITDNLSLSTEYNKDIDWHKGNTSNEDYTRWLECKIIKNSIN